MANVKIKIRQDKEWDEWVVEVRINGKLNKAKSYHTDSFEDAQNTRCEMVKEAKEHPERYELAKKKHTYEFEVTLSVARYWEEDSESAFENCKQDFDAALEVAQEELTEAGVAKALDNMGGMKIKVVGFVEFDVSGNPSHAGGYFLVEVSGSKEDVATVEELHTKWLKG